MKMLKEVIPDKSVSRVVDMLYKTMVRRDAEGNKRNEEEIIQIVQNGVDKQNTRRTSLHVFESNIKALGRI